MQLKAITPHPITGYLGKEVTLWLAITSFQGVLDSKVSFSQNNPVKEAKFCHAHLDTLGFVEPEVRTELCWWQIFHRKGESSMAGDKILMLILATHCNPTPGFSMKELLRKSVDVSAFIYISRCSLFSFLWYNSQRCVCCSFGVHTLSQAAGWPVIIWS